jgi:hypothetical protein
MAFDSARRRVVLFGGRDSSYSPLGDTWEFDGSSWTQVHPTTLPRPRRAACMAYDAGRGTVVLFGGADSGGSRMDTWLWDGHDWTAGPTGPSARRSCAMAYDYARDALVMFGGATGDRNAGGPIALGDTWIYE